MKREQIIEYVMKNGKQQTSDNNVGICLLMHNGSVLSIPCRLEIRLSRKCSWLETSVSQSADKNHESKYNSGILQETNQIISKTVATTTDVSQTYLHLTAPPRAHH